MISRRALLAGVSAGALASGEALANLVQFRVSVGGQTQSGAIAFSGAGALNGTGNIPLPPGSTLATLTLVNESGASSTVAGMPTSSFGWIFKKGDIPNASTNAPVFKDAVTGNALAFSASVPEMRRYWPDGSLLYCVFAIIPDPTSVISASGTRNVTISSGGSWPTMGSGTAGVARTLTEVNAQNLALSLPVAPITNNGLGGAAAGNWGSWCDTVGNSNNLITTGAFKVAKDLDGAAGTRWRLNFKCSQSKNGTTGIAYGQLISTYYVWGISDQNAALGGFRWSCYIRQPYYNLDSPTKAARVFSAPNYTTPANGPNWTASGVSASPMPFKGGNGAAITSRACTRTGASTLTTNTSHNYVFGSRDGVQYISGYFTGSVPTGINTTDVFHALASGSNDMTIYVGASKCSNENVANMSGGGSFTFNPVIAANQFGRIGFKDDNGRFLYFQGTGNKAADTTIRVKIDRTYWISTGLIPAWDYPTLKSTADGGAITEAWYRSNPWNPLTWGVINRDQSGVGDHEDIGVYPNEAALDFFNQSLVSERAIRAFANGHCMMAADFRDLSTVGSIPNLSSSNYTGMQNGAVGIYGSLQWFGNPNSVAGTWGGAAVPTYDNGDKGLSDIPCEHRPNYAVWAWLRTGELEYLEFMQEHANYGLLVIVPYQRNMASPSTIVGTPLGYDVENRAMGWKFCGISQAALFGPYDPANPTTVSIDGTLTTKYHLDTVLRTTQRVRDIFNPANNYFNAQNGNATTLFTGGTTNAFAGKKHLALYNEFQARPPTTNGMFLGDGPMPHCGYIYYSYLMAYLMGDPNGSWCVDAGIQQWLSIVQDYGHHGSGGAGGGWNMYCYYYKWGEWAGGDSGHHECRLLNQANNRLAPDWQSGGVSKTITWTSGTTFNLTVANIDGYLIENGDILVFNSTGSGFGSVSNPELNGKSLYITNYNSTTGNCNLSLTEGGTSISMASGAGSDSGFAIVQNGIASRGEDRSLDWNARVANGASWLIQMRQQGNWIRTARTINDGTTYTAGDPVLDDINHRLQFTSGGWSTNGLTVPSAGFHDARYAVRATP